MTSTGPPDTGARRRPPALALAAILVAAAALAASLWLAGGLRLDGTTGDWRAASEGLYRSGQPGILGAGRRVVAHLHGLDGRPAELEVTVIARPAASPVRLTILGADGPGTAEVGLEPTAVRVPLRRGTRDIDMQVEASALFRVAGIALVRARGLGWAIAGAVGAMVGILVLVAAWGRPSRWTAVVWAVLAALAAVCAGTFLADPVSFLRVSPAVRLTLRLGALASLWGAAIVCARSRLAGAVAIGGTVALLHLPTVWYGFYQDDFALARAWSWHELASTLHGEFDPSGMIPAYYRPVVRMSWAVDHALWGAWTPGYHATNLLLHAAAGVLLAALLRRASLPAAAALLGALVWVAHPLAASVATWVSARGDSLMAVSYLAALIAFSSPASNTRRSLATLAALSALALLTKEMAASLVLTAFLLDRVLLPRDQRRLRRPRLRSIALVTAAYLALWAAFFAFKVVYRASGGARWAGFDAHDAGHWLRLVPGLYAPIVLPTSYETWWTTPLEGWSAAYLLAALAVAAAAWGVARVTPLGRAAATAGVIWPLLAVLPLLGLSNTLDLYRLGYVVAIGLAFVVAALAARLERWPVATPAAAGVLVILLAPLSIEAAQAWAPDGFRGRASLHWKSKETEWVGQLSPEMQGLFRETVAWRCHARGWAYPDDPCP